MVYRVSIWLTINPPMIVMPSGRRSSEPGAGPQSERQRAEQRCHGGHQDRPETQQARLIDRFFGGFIFLAFGGQREVDHHDRVFLHDSDQQDDADERNDAEVHVEKQEREHRAHTRRTEAWIES